MAEDDVNTILRCSDIRSTFNYVTCSIGILIGICSCYVYYTNMKIDHKEPKWMICLGNIFCISVIMSIFSMSALMLELALCDHILFSYWIIRKMSFYFYLLQAVLILLLFYRKMVIAFKDTVLELTQCTVTFFSILFIIFSMIVCIFPIISFIPAMQHLLISFSAAYIICYFVTMISSSVLFIYKLNKLINNFDDIQHIHQFSHYPCINHLQSQFYHRSHLRDMHFYRLFY